VFLFGVGHEIIGTSKQRKRRNMKRSFQECGLQFLPTKIALSKGKRDLPLGGSRSSMTLMGDLPLREDP
jgi:hypothetical protein